MERIIEQSWQYLKTTTVVAIMLIIIANFYETNGNVYILGLYLFSGWLLTPLATYWMLGDHDWPITFMVRVYPKIIRKFVSYGLLVTMVILTIIWGYLVIHVNFS